MKARDRKLNKIRVDCSVPFELGSDKDLSNSYSMYMYIADGRNEPDKK